MATTPRTRAEEAYLRIRADILNGTLQPGAKLPFADLSARYGASMSVIREGLSRLVAQGLVRAEPQQGFRVIPISIDDLRDLTTARTAVETAALRLSIEHGDIAWESRVVAAHHALERTPWWSVDEPHHITEEWAAVHAAFHEALLAGCPSTRLTAVAMSLRDAAELYRRWSQPHEKADARDVAAEHRALAQATLDRDVDAAVKLLTEHLDVTAGLLIGRAQEEGLSEHVAALAARTA